MKRKLLALLSLMLCLVLAFSLTSCFGSEEEEEEIDPKVKQTKWDQYLALDGYNSFTVKATSNGNSVTIKAVDGECRFLGSNGEVTNTGSYSSLVSFINELFPNSISESSLAFANASFDKKTNSYAISCFSESGMYEYKINVYFADKVLDKVTVSATSVLESSVTKYTLKFSKWNKTSF